LPARIVVVDQSTDDLSAVVVAETECDGVPIEYIRHVGSGLGVSQNIAFRAAREPVIAVTDDDCVPAPDWLHTVSLAFEKHPGLAGLAGAVLGLGPARPGFTTVSLRTSTDEALFAGRAYPWDVGSGNNFAVRREWLKRIGGNDERLGPGAPGQGRSTWTSSTAWSGRVPS
jgi:cellulose synthase/poly-beta-1,6-N-acetylglucosamine synthase-like glycosyltransferase